MRFRVPGEAFEFQIEDADWVFAGMKQFRPSVPFFLYPRGLDVSGVDLRVVPLAQIEPCAPRFERAGSLARERIVPILLAFLSQEGVLPPVQVEPLDGSRYSFRLVNGFHRYCASIAAGFTEIPIVTHALAWRRP
ncbi:MAG: ParB N-terminal domain-containing protein [Betaproteobacteria bacterium]|nr:ParB N-terminal domain-containing protein [Betaproteobacteria bacterium]MDE2153011.1 ParB N-terminal domain-containing protein [Betaproteobacteria bacterium]